MLYASRVYVEMRHEIAQKHTQGYEAYVEEQEAPESVLARAAAQRPVDDIEVVDIKYKYIVKSAGIEAGRAEHETSARHGERHKQLGQYENYNNEEQVHNRGCEAPSARFVICYRIHLLYVLSHGLMRKYNQ